MNYTARKLRTRSRYAKGTHLRLLVLVAIALALAIVGGNHFAQVAAERKRLSKSKTRSKAAPREAERDERVPSSKQWSGRDFTFGEEILRAGTYQYRLVYTNAPVLVEQQHDELTRTVGSGYAIKVFEHAHGTHYFCVLHFCWLTRSRACAAKWCQPWQIAGVA